MDPLQVEAQLRNTFLTLLGGDMSIYEGQKQQMQQRFNNEARQVAINMVAQATNQNRAITMTDYQNVSLQLLDAYKRSTPAPQMYAGQMQQVQPMYQMGQPIQPMYQMAPMQPMVQQPLYVQPQPMMVQQQGFNSGLRYTQPVRPLYQQTAYQPMQQTIAVGDTNKNLYAGALPANAQPPQQMQMPQQTFVAPMSTVQKAVTPISIKNEAPLIQPVVSAYDMPPVTKRRVFQNKSPYTVNGEVVTYQRSDGTNIQAVVCTVTSPVADIDAFAKTLAKKEGAHDITLKEILRQQFHYIRENIIYEIEDATDEEANEDEVETRWNEWIDEHLDEGDYGKCYSYKWEYDDGDTVYKFYIDEIELK